MCSPMGSPDRHGLPREFPRECDNDSADEDPVEPKEEAENRGDETVCSVTSDAQSFDPPLRVAEPSLQDDAEPGSSSMAWRSEILRQAEARDVPMTGVRALYVQYHQCVQSLQASAGSGSNAGPFANPPVDGFQQPSDRELSRRPVSVQEYEALQQLLKEREEELAEKDEAHRLLCRQAELMDSENKQIKEQLQAKTVEMDRLKSQLQTLRADSSGRHSNGEQATAAKPPELPMKRCTFRKIHNAAVTCVAAASGQSPPLPPSLVAVGTADGFVKLLNGETLRPYAQLQLSRESPSQLVAVDLAPCKGLLLAAAADQALRLLDLHQQRLLLHPLRGHRDALSSCGFLRDTGKAFTASMDKTVKLWDLEKGQTLKSTPTSSPITGASVQSSSGVVVTGHSDGSISVLDPREGARDVQQTPVHGGKGIVGLHVSPDGRSAVSQAEDGTLCITALGTLRTVHTFDVGVGRVEGPSAPAFSADGTHVIARGANMICCWNADTGARVCIHEEQQQPVAVCWNFHMALSLHRDGHAALWGSEDSSSQ